MKKVNVFKYERFGDNSHFDRIFDYQAEFHQFGVDYEEFETGAGNYSTAIVELANGEIKNVPVELITFIK